LRAKLQCGRTSRYPESGRKYDLIDGLGILGEDVVKSLLQVILSRDEIFIVDLDLFDKPLGNDLVIPSFEVNRLNDIKLTLVLSVACLL
jgi:hypothetical protein